MPRLLQPTVPRLRALKDPIAHLAGIAARVREAAGLEDIPPITLPLESMATLFARYSEGRAAELPSIDHARLALACLTNYRDVLDGREQPKYMGLLDQYAQNTGFARSLGERAGGSLLLRLLLQTLVFGEGKRRSPHDLLLKTLAEAFARAPADGGFLANLLRALRDPTGYGDALVQECLSKQRRPEQLWERRGFLDDSHAWRVFLDPLYDAVLSQALVAPQKVGPDAVDYALRIALDFGLGEDLLTPRVEKAILAAEAAPALQQPLFEHLEAHLGNPPKWDPLPGVSTQARRAYERLRGLAEFHYFELIAHIIHDQLLDESAEGDRDRLRNRTLFWSNYGDQIEEIKIFLSPDTKRGLRQWKWEGDGSFRVSDAFLNRIGRCAEDTEIVCLLIGDVLFVEYFRGAANHTRVIPGGKQLFKELQGAAVLLGSHLRTLQLHSKWGFRHRYLWQIPAMNFLSETLGINVRRDFVLIPGREKKFGVANRMSRANAKNKNSPAIRQSDYEDYKDLHTQVVVDFRNQDIWER